MQLADAWGDTIVAQQRLIAEQQMVVEESKTRIRELERNVELFAGDLTRVTQEAAVTKSGDWRCIVPWTGAALLDSPPLLCVPCDALLDSPPISSTHFTADYASSRAPLQARFCSLCTLCHLLYLLLLVSACRSFMISLSELLHVCRSFETERRFKTGERSEQRGDGAASEQDVPPSSRCIFIAREECA